MVPDPMCSSASLGGGFFADDASTKYLPPLTYGVQALILLIQSWIYKDFKGPSILETDSVIMWLLTAHPNILAKSKISDVQGFSVLVKLY